MRSFLLLTWLVAACAPADDEGLYGDDGAYGRGTYAGDSCTVDCSGHEAGYEWAEDNDITDESDCYGDSQSFEEGCVAFVEGRSPEDEAPLDETYDPGDYYR